MKRGATRLVLAATAAFGALTAFWSVLTPLTEAPDEPAHLGLVLHVADTGDYPAYDGLQHTRGLFRLCVDFAASASWCRTAEERAAGIVLRDHPAGDAPPRSRRPHWDDADFRALEPGRMNQMPQHPPLYYELMATGLRSWRAVAPHRTVDAELAFLRLLNVLLVLPLPWLAWLTARRLGLGRRTGTVAALVPLAVPQLTHIGSTLNNDNLFVVLASALMVLLAGVARGDRSLRTAVLVGLASGLALLTKGFGVVLPPVVAFAYWTGAASPGVAGAPAPPCSPGGRSPARSARRVSRVWPASRVWRESCVWWRRALVAAWPAAGAVTLGLLVSGWWYAGNLATEGRLMPSIEDTGRLHPSTRPPRFQPDVGEYLGSTTARLVQGFWGDFGWRRVHLPATVSAVATVLCLAAIVAALRARAETGHSRVETGDTPTATVHPWVETGDARPLPAGRPALALLLAPLVLLGGFVVVRSAVIYAETGRLAFQQGRYLFGGLTAASVVVAAGLVDRCGERAVAAVVLAAATLQGIAVVSCLDGWWDVTDVGLAGALGAVVAWSGWPAPVAAILLALAPVQLAVPAVVAARTGARRDAPLSRRRSRAARAPESTAGAAGRARTPARAGPAVRTRPRAAGPAAARSAPGCRTAASEDPPPGS